MLAWARASLLSPFSCLFVSVAHRFLCSALWIGLLPQRLGQGEVEIGFEEGRASTLEARRPGGRCRCFRGGKDGEEVDGWPEEEDVSTSEEQRLPEAGDEGMAAPRHKETEEPAASINDVVLRLPPGLRFSLVVLQVRLVVLRQCDTNRAGGATAFQACLAAVEEAPVPVRCRPACAHHPVADNF